MGKQSDGVPFFYAQKGTWYVWHRGKRVSLRVKGRGNRREAHDALGRLDTTDLPILQRTPVAVLQPQPAALGTVRELVSAYLAAADVRGLKASSLKVMGRFLNPFADAFGEKPVGTVTVQDAYTFALNPNWSTSTRHIACSNVASFMKWAGCPLKGFRIPPMQSRGVKAVIPEADAERLIAEARGDMSPLLRFLWLTGCRPSEALTLTADMVREGDGVCVLENHKTAKQTARPRYIYLSGEAVALLKSQRERHGAGFLFRTTEGKPITLNNAVNILWRLNRKLGTSATLYGFRHSFATEGLAKGIPETHVAELLGHSSTKMLSAHYSHLSAKANTMRASAERVRG